MPPTRPAPPDGPDEIELDEVAAMLLAGLDARGREIQREVLDPFNRDAAATNRVVAERCGLAPDAIGTTHAVVPGRPPRLRRVPPGAGA